VTIKVILLTADPSVWFLSAPCCSLLRHHDCQLPAVIVVAFSYYYEDPGGLIPSWIINWAAKVSSCFVIALCIRYLLYKKVCHFF